MSKQSAVVAVRNAKASDAKARKAQSGVVVPLPHGKQAGTEAVTLDSFVNFAHKLGIGADNALTTSTYGYNPITRNRQQLEWIHRGSWLGGVAVDLVADDMTRAGVEFVTDLAPTETETIQNSAIQLQVWDQMNECLRWGRLYGGCIAVALVDGQDVATPLNIDSVGKGQFKGLLVLDRWLVEPSLDDLVTEFGPCLGLPRYYKVMSSAPALRGMNIHYTRVMMRVEGIQLPYNQRLTENLWGISVIERLYDRMIAFDSASTGAAQLVYKAYLRTLKIEGLRDIIAAGGAPMSGILAYVNVMSRYQGQEGITLLDGKDEFDVQQHSAFSGLSDALNQFGQQLSGALQIPLVRLFGQSPAGLSSSGEADLRMYYDNVNQQQNKTMRTGVTLIYQLLAKGTGVTLPDNFSLRFVSLWQLRDMEKADIAQKVAQTLVSAYTDGLISQRTALQELRDLGRVTGVFTNITDEMIEQADDTLPPAGGLGENPLEADAVDPVAQVLAMYGKKETQSDDPKTAPGADDNGSRRRVRLQPETPAGR